MQSSVISEKNVQLMCDSPFVVKLYVAWRQKCSQSQSCTRFGLFCHFLFRIFSNLFRISSSFFFHILFHVCINDILCNIILIFRIFFASFLWFFDSPCRHAGHAANRATKSLGNLQLRSTSPPAAGAGAGRWTLRHLQQTESLGSGPDDHDDHDDRVTGAGEAGRNKRFLQKVAE